MRNFLWLGVVLGFVSIRLASAGEKVSQGVIEALRREGGANVVVALVEPLSMRAPRIDLPTLRSEIASMRSQVLSTLDPTDYRERHRYEAIPSLAIWVTKAGLAKLIAHPKVVRIDLDVGGTGKPRKRNCDRHRK
jgi:hypothetical protein